MTSGGSNERLFNDCHSYEVIDYLETCISSAYYWFSRNYELFDIMKAQQSDRSECKRAREQLSQRLKRTKILRRLKVKKYSVHRETARLNGCYRLPEKESFKISSTLSFTQRDSVILFVISFGGIEYFWRGSTPSGKDQFLRSWNKFYISTNAPNYKFI